MAKYWKRGIGKSFHGIMFRNNKGYEWDTRKRRYRRTKHWDDWANKGQH